MYKFLEIIYATGTQRSVVVDMNTFTKIEASQKSIVNCEYLKFDCWMQDSEGKMKEAVFNLNTERVCSLCLMDAPDNILGNRSE